MHSILDRIQTLSDRKPQLTSVTCERLASIHGILTQQIKILHAILYPEDKPGLEDYICVEEFLNEVCEEERKIAASCPTFR